jgi:hypothetical protein
MSLRAAKTNFASISDKFIFAFYIEANYVSVVLGVLSVFEHYILKVLRGKLFRDFDISFLGLY